MKYLSDQVVSWLQAAVQSLDLAGTRYRALKFLGRGGMGTIWLVEDAVLNRKVALKVLTVDSGSEYLASRLMREAVVLARLEHPGIVPVHDAGTLADGAVFYCMKYVEGQTLDEHIAGTSLRERLQLLQRIAEPLAFAHAHGIVHRDLKPGNIMIGAFGEVLIMDWGLAKVMKATAGEVSNNNDGDDSTRSRVIQAGSATASSSVVSTATAHGAVLGTPGYMAPEQASGQVALIGERTDVYGLGAILGFMLEESTAEPRESPAPKALRAICHKAMAQEISARYKSVREMASDIGCFLEGLPVNAYRENILERTVRLLRRHRGAVVLVAAYLLMRILFVLFSRR
jgi:serine/threonine protein kinase